MTPEGVEEVVLTSIEKLLERDNPSLETIRMQVEYDTSYIENENEAAKTIRIRNKLIQSNKQTISDIQLEDSNDFTTLTILYRKIFRFLIEFTPNVKTLHDKLMDREIAAALESVFPRVGLKAFIVLSSDEKNLQLMELARIILGIRLYNRSQNKGGVDLENMDSDGINLAVTMSDDISNEINYFSDACHKYQVAIIKANLLKRKAMLLDKKLAEEKLIQTNKTSLVTNHSTVRTTNKYYFTL